jgi:osmotically inducible protein OsmC
MPARKGTAVWNGTLKEGKGSMKLGSGAYEGPFSFQSRFEEGAGTNPEELIGAALAGCFSMAMSANLEKAGHPAQHVSTRANVKLEMVDGKPTPALYIGREIVEENTCCYFEVANIKSIKKLLILNKLLYDWQPEQVNMHVVKYNKQEKTYKLEYPDFEAVFGF